MATTEQVKNDQENETNSQETAAKKKKGKPFFSILLLIFLFVAILSIPLIFTRFNIMGAGDSLRPVLKSNSIFRKFLPPNKNPNDIHYMNREQLINLVNKYKDKITTLETQLREAERVAKVYTGSPNGFEKIESDKKEIEAQKKQLQKEKEKLKKLKKDFFEQVAEQDTSSFRQYYENMDSETAEKIYKEVMQEEKASKKIQAFVSYYEDMEPSSAAKIFEYMSKTQISLVAKILKNMDEKNASQILEAMDSKVVGRITDILAEQTPILD